MYKRQVIYGAGIAGDSNFEQGMTGDCEVHAFDCTVSREAAVVTGKNFTFHQTCVGDAQHVSDETVKVLNQGSHSARTRHCIRALFSLSRVHCVCYRC